MESVWDIIDDLTPEQSHELFVNINRWRTGTPVEFQDLAIKLLFSQMKPTLETQAKNYKSKVENGKKGGAPIGNQNAKKQPNTTENNQEQSNLTENNRNNHREKEREKEKEKERERERESVVDTTLTPTIQFNKLQSLFDDDPRYYGSNKRLWEALDVWDQELALSKAEDYIKWETRSRKDLGFYLQDRKWELDLTISTKSTNDNMEPDWNDPHLDWSKYV